MAVVVLTFSGSEQEIIDGIPRFMTIESNIPSTIYFTLDGTTPTLDSTIYVNTFEMPDGQNSVTLSAFGVDSDGYVGAILTQTFAPNTTKIDITRLIGAEGIVVDRVDDLTNIETGFGPESDGAIRFSDIPLHELELTLSDQGFGGIGEGTAISVGKYSADQTVWPFDDNFVAFSSPENSQSFNPWAKTIVNDERLDNELRILNRPYGSLRTPQRNDWGQRELGGVDSSYISGGFLRRFYDTRNNVMVSYYFDHNTGRYIKGIQDLPSNIPQVFASNISGQPLVFQWINRGRHSSTLI